MSIIGPDLPPVARDLAGATRKPASGFSLPTPTVRRADSVVLGTGTPPPEALDAVGAAAEKAEQMAADDRELHFALDESTGRVTVQVRRLSTGEVLRHIPAASALDLLSGVE